MGQFKGLEVTGKLKVAQKLEKSPVEPNPDEDLAQVPVPSDQFRGLELTGESKVAQGLGTPLVESNPDEDVVLPSVPTGQFRGLGITRKLQAAQGLGTPPVEPNADEDVVLPPVPTGQFRGLGITRKLQVVQELGTPPVELNPVEDLALSPFADHATQNLPKQKASALLFLKPIFTWSSGCIVIGLLILLTGVLWGVSSPRIPYIGVPKELDYAYGTTNKGDIYIYSTNHSIFFVARHNDFSHPVDLTKSNQDILVYVLARPDTINVNDTIDGKVHATQAHVIERLEVQDTNKHPLGTYTARDYNPSGIYENRWWPVAVALIAAGLLIICVASFVGLKRRKRASLALNA